jgi:hypothetical protein
MTELHAVSIAGPAAGAAPGLAAARLLLAGFPAPELEALAAALGPAAAPRLAELSAAAVSCVERHGALVLCLGSLLAGDEACRLLECLAPLVPKERSCFVVLGAGSELGRFQDLVDDERLYYLCPSPPPLADVVDLLRSALDALDPGGRPPAWRSGGDAEPPAPSDLEASLLLAPLLARQASLAQAVAVAAQRALELGDADRARLWVHEPERDTLWTPRQGGREEARVSAAAGLVGFVNRTGREVRLARVGADPRFDPESDDEDGSPQDRFLALPVHAPGLGFTGVLALVRAAGRPPFGSRECEALGRLAALSAPILELIAARDRHESLTVRRHGIMGSELADLFRPEALERHVGAEREPSPMLRLSGHWLRRAYWLLLALTLAAAAAAGRGSVREYAAGWAVVRLAPRTAAAGDAPLGRVVALLPGRYRPLVRSGMPLRLELEGFRGSDERLVIDRVSPSVVSPAEARRRLGPEIGDGAPPLPGPVFLVEAPLPAATFGSSSGAYAFYDGLPGTAEVLVRSERIVDKLFPAWLGRR